MNRWLQLLTNRLRFKVLCVALGVAAISGTGGWLGLRYTDSVNTSVTDTNELYLPLLTNAVNASNAMHNLSLLAHNLLLACERADDSHRALMNGSLAKNIAIIDTLARFLQDTGIRVYEVKVRSAKEEMLNAFDSLSNSCDTQVLLQQAFEARLSDIDSAITEINGVIRALRSDAPSAPKPMPEASTDSRDRLELQLDLMSARLGEIGTVLLHNHSNTLAKNGDQVIRLNEEKMATLSTQYEILAPLLVKSGFTRENDLIEHALTQISQAVSGPDGIHDIWRRTSLFHSGTIITRMAMSRTDIALASALSGMEAEARARYAQALAHTGRSIEEARWVVIGVTLAIAVVLLASGLLLAAGFVRPIESLKAFVIKLRGSEDLSQRMPDQLLARKDEVGELAHSFNELIVDLADARQHLLSESQARIRTQYDRLSSAIESIPQGLCLIDADNRLLMSNSRFMTLYELTPDDLREGTPLQQVMDTCIARGAKPIRHDGTSEHPERFSAFSRKPLVFNFRNQRTILVRTARTPEGGLVSVHEDITERRRQEQQIAHLAYHDTLTGLPNRRLFRDTFGKLLGDPEQKREVALLFMDLDLFKTVNDTLGHPLGDQLLVAVAERLQACLRDTDRVARVGGDEFAVLLTDDSSTEEAIRISRRIIDKIGRPYNIEGHVIVVGISIGIAISPRDGHDPDRLMKCADLALYRAKDEGRNRYSFFEQEMGARLQARRTLEMELRQAVDAEALDLAFQPQVDIATGKIQGFEALLRWHHQERGYISPEEFIPIAEETGLITTIGRWVLMRACHEARDWPLPLQIGVNISPIQFRAKTLAADVKAALSASGLAPHRLELEITEGILMQDTLTNLELLEELRRMGVHIAMDDFGTGYSSLGYIRKFHFDRIKIDKSFVHDVLSSSDSQAVVQAVCGLCATLGIQSVAEGVEDAQQLAFLRREGCSQAQGYYIAKPMTAAQAREMLTNRVEIL
ncbi:EAL domain-containing protein [Marinobacterium sp. D7]|uniref:EAL domain-containing protein n=1 Tax=Marinobacterium ramblicola TaxID=2849041 RepID=UPI001C2D92AE|nr:EAL domain-containing protein [Marinobacterium ramblicola]MBV1790291.1 EAL domain-containing protein [Marinobacterium ramblicola]